MKASSNAGLVFSNWKTSFWHSISNLCMKRIRVQIDMELLRVLMPYLFMAEDDIPIFDIKQFSNNTGISQNK